MRRKGEITSAVILRTHPFHVVFPEGVERDLLRGAQFYRSSALRSATRTRNGVLEVVICFGEKADAEAFMRHAGGVLEGE